MPSLSVTSQPVSPILQAALPADRNQPDGAVHNQKLDHLRFLAALMILLHHGVPAILCAVKGVACEASNSLALTSGGNGFDRVIRALVFEGHSAVALFITLSGFLFARICGRQDVHYGKFVLNRILRIYPLYTCAISLALYLAPGSNNILNLFASLLCLQNIYGPVAHPLITPPLWTVAVEFQFYLLFPFFLSFFIKKGARPLLLLLGASLLLKALVFVSNGSVRELSYQTLFGRIDQFIPGMLCAWYYPRYAQLLKHKASPLLAIGLVIALLTAFHLGAGGFWSSARSPIWIVWPLVESMAWALLITSYCASSFHLPQRLSAVLCGLGAVSFSMYIWHYGIAHLMAQKLGPVLKTALEHDSHPLHCAVACFFHNLFYGSVWFVALLVLPCVLVVSTITYKAIEKPFMDLRVKYRR